MTLAAAVAASAEAAVTKLHGRDAEATVTLERLLASTWRERDSYRRRRERVQREAEQERERRSVRTEHRRPKTHSML